MPSRIVLLVLFLLHAPMAAAERVVLAAADGVKVYGEFWPAVPAQAPLILAFHQAGSSRAEDAPLAPRLNRAGFSVLAIDPRSGGPEFGGKNLTVAGFGRSTAYDAALADLEAALAWGQSRFKGAPIIVWGSSYSAALVFVLAPRPAQAPWRARFGHAARRSQLRGRRRKLVRRAELSGRVQGCAVTPSGTPGHVLDPGLTRA